MTDTYRIRMPDGSVRKEAPVRFESVGLEQATPSTQTTVKRLREPVFRLPGFHLRRAAADEEADYVAVPAGQ